MSTTKQKMSVTKRLYQRNIPIFLCSMFVGLLFVHSIAPVQQLVTLRTAALSWANLISLLVWSFAVATLLLSNTRRIFQAGIESRRRYESMLIMATIIFFLLLRFSTPALESGEVYSYIFMNLTTKINVGLGTVSVTYFVYNVWKRITQSRISPEIIGFLVVFYITILRQMAIATNTIPLTIVLGDWVEQILYATMMRGLILVTAIGTLMVAVRALIGREPGMIEMEMQ